MHIVYPPTCAYSWNRPTLLILFNSSMCFSGVPSLSPSTSSEVQWLIPLASSLYSISQNHLTVAFLINHYTRLTGSNPNSLLHSACLLSINFSFNIKHHDLIMFTSLVFNSTSCFDFTDQILLPYLSLFVHKNGR